MEVHNYLEQLNKNQADAVVNIQGPCMIIAGAGSGKTRVLTYRIVHLINSGISPRNILALTFTNKAAKEMKERIDSLFGYNISKELWMGTFHSIFSKILRIEAEFTGYTSSYTIYDTEDSKNVLKAIVRELNLDDKVYKVNEVLNRISWAKNNLLSAPIYANSTEAITNDKYSRKPEIHKIYSIYANRCRQSNAMDFDDLLLNINILFRDHPDVLEKYQNKLHYILVDEYQDTNFSQYLILKRLAAKKRNISVVGDDAQSIYSFRGARIENILNFKNDYPEFRLYKLEQNYRSTQNIVNAANSLISKNKGQIHKIVFSENEAGNKVKLIQAFTDNEEGFKVSNLIIDSLQTDKLSYGDYAILYRTNAQSRIFEEALRKRNIPYKIYGGISFYKRKEIKDVIAYFRLVINNRDDEALKRVINYPARGIGKTTFDKIVELAIKCECTTWDVIAQIDHFNTLFNKGTLLRIKYFVDFIKSFSAKLYTTDAYELAFEIVGTTGIIKELQEEKTLESQNKEENIQELLNGLKEFTINQEADVPLSLDQYIENISLLLDIDDEGKEDKNKVVLMTVHSAKGLEFENVYIVGVEKDLFPSAFCKDNPEQIEEERRLFYVAITRAKKSVTVSFAKSRYKWGVPTTCQPSMFIKDLDTRFVDCDFEVAGDDIEERINNRFPTNINEFMPREKSKPPTFKSVAKSLKGKKPLRQIEARTSTPTTTDGNLIAGALVDHERFGRGKVLNIEGEYANMKVTVDFGNAGIKQLLVKYAKLKVL